MKSLKITSLMKDLFLSDVNLWLFWRFEADPGRERSNQYKFPPVPVFGEWQRGNSWWQN